MSFIKAVFSSRVTILEDNLERNPTSTEMRHWRESLTRRAAMSGFKVSSFQQPQDQPNSRIVIFESVSGKFSASTLKRLFAAIAVKSFATPTGVIHGMDLLAPPESMTETAQAEPGFSIVG